MAHLDNAYYNRLVKPCNVGNARKAAEALEFLSDNSDEPSDADYRQVAQDFGVALDVLECEYFAVRGL